MSGELEFDKDGWMKDIQDGFEDIIKNTLDNFETDIIS